MGTHQKVFFAKYLKKIRCHFCGKPVTVIGGSGKDSLHIHHLDHDQENNNPENLVPAHASCHLVHHSTGNTHRRNAVIDESSRKKMSAAKKGKPWTPARRAALR